MWLYMPVTLAVGINESHPRLYRKIVSKTNKIDRQTHTHRQYGREQQTSHIKLIFCWVELLPLSWIPKSLFSLKLLVS